MSHWETGAMVVEGHWKRYNDVQSRVEFELSQKRIGPADVKDRISELREAIREKGS